MRLKNANFMILDDDTFDSITNDDTRKYEVEEKGIISISYGILVANWESDWETKIQKIAPAVLIYHDTEELEQALPKNVIPLRMSGEGENPYRVKKAITHLLEEKKERDDYIIAVKPFIVSKQINKYREEILQSFLPLHLSLQAFFGISRDEKGDWVYFGKDESCTTEMENAGIRIVDISLEFGKQFPNTNAFLLVPEAEWDFYASIFDRVMPPEACDGIRGDFEANCDEEEKDYSKENNIAELLWKLLKNIKEGTNAYEKLQALRDTLSKKYSQEDNGGYSTFFELRGKIRGITFAEFTRSLREICAILADTFPSTDQKCRKNGKTFVYKGKCGAERDRILMDIWGENKSKLKENLHSKILPNANYDSLKLQIEEWGKANDFKKAKIVIQGVEEFADCLNDYIIKSNKGYPE